MQKCFVSGDKWEECVCVCVVFSLLPNDLALSSKCEYFNADSKRADKTKERLFLKLSHNRVDSVGLLRSGISVF